MHAIANPDQPGSAAPLFFGARNSSFALSKYRRLNRLVEVPGRNLKSAIRHLKSSEAWCLLQRGEEQIPVPVIVEDRLPPVAAIHHVVIAPGYSALNLWAMPGEWPSPHHVTISRSLHEEVRCRYDLGKSWSIRDLHRRRQNFYSSARIRTGPSSPEGRSGDLATNLRMFVSVKRSFVGSASSPIRRFGHRLTTVTSSSFTPAFTAPAMLTRAGLVQTTPRLFPFTRNSATSRTSPRSRTS